MASGSQHVQALGRGLAVIEAFDADHAEMTLSEVATRTGLSRATARRLLLTLLELGFTRAEGRLFMLTPQVLRLGHAYLSSMGLPAVAGPHLEQLSAKVAESVSVAVLDGADIAYVARVAARSIMTVNISVGTRFPAYATSMGRVLLANLDAQCIDGQLAMVDFRPLTDRTVLSEASLRTELATVRGQGFSVVAEELEPGLRSIAVPVTGRNGQCVAAINIATHTSAFAGDLVRSYLAPLRETAQAIGRDLRAT